MTAPHLKGGLTPPTQSKAKLALQQAVLPSLVGHAFDWQPGPGGGWRVPYGVARVGTSKNPEFCQIYLCNLLIYRT